MKTRVKGVAWWCAAVLAGWAAAEEKPRLPLPRRGIPEMPALLPSVVTAAGQKLLLSQTGVTVAYADGALRVTPSEWWVINYPLTRIRGFEGESADAVSERLFGVRASGVRNWYVRSPGIAPAEPEAPAGPAPIALSEPVTCVVDAAHPQADDQGEGTAAAPLQTIQAAVRRARPGAVIRVMPGVYRERVTVKASGTRAAPIRLEGVRDRSGRMPVVSGNDLFPAGAWKPVAGLPGVWRAEIFTRYMGSLSVGGRALIEQSLPSELREGEFCFNRASREFLNLRFDGTLNPREGAMQAGHPWRRAAADGEGFIDLAAAEGGAGVVWASAHIWAEPKARRDGVVWHPDFPEPITGSLETGGEFRAARMNGAGLQSQVNKYRLWVNGKLLPSVVYANETNAAAGLPHPHRNYGYSDKWSNVTFKEGWNHLVFQFDTTVRPKQTRFRFGLPKGMEQAVTSAAEPADRTKPGPGGARDHLAECLLLGPFPSEPDGGVYARLPGGADPNQTDADLAARGTLVEVAGDFVEIRGFEIRHGGQFQQKAQVALEGEGLLLEGCLVAESEVKGISFTCAKHQDAAPTVIRNNWVVRPGNTGIGGSGATDQLTPENQDAAVPGRSPVWLEYNTVIGNNWAGFPPFWESGGFKVFKLTGCVIRHNTIVGGCGPGIWLDWEHFGNRLEGNLFLNGWGFAIGIEASPGPNLVANNLCVDLRPGPVWFREAFLSWSTDRNIVVNNTADGRWSALPAWQKKTGTGGIYLGEGGADRRTRWVPLEQRRQVIVNNLVVGCREAVRAKPGDCARGNYTDKGRGAEAIGDPDCFRDAAAGDYRLRAGHPLNTNGVETAETPQVRHDFHGLLRFPEAGRSVGACRGEVEDGPDRRTVIEVEYQDGAMRRL